MIEPSDIERAELPECSAKYIEDLEAEIERKDEALRNVIYTCDQYYGNATGLHMTVDFLITNCKQALQNKEESGE